MPKGEYVVEGDINQMLSGLVLINTPPHRVGVRGVVYSPPETHSVCVISDGRSDSPIGKTDGNGWKTLGYIVPNALLHKLLSENLPKVRSSYFFATIMLRSDGRTALVVYPADSEDSASNRVRIVFDPAA